MDSTIDTRLNDSINYKKIFGEQNGHFWVDYPFMYAGYLFLLLVFLHCPFYFILF